MPKEPYEALTARELATAVDNLLNTHRGTQALSQWQPEFEKELEEYARRYELAEKNLDKARKRVKKEAIAVQEGRMKPRLTDSKREPPKGHVWRDNVISLPIPDTAAGRVVGAWVPRAVAKRLEEGREPPPFCSKNPSLAVQCMVLAHFHDAYFPEGANLFGAPDGESEMSDFRQDYRFDDWEQCTSWDELDNPSESYGENRLNVIQTYLNSVRAHFDAEAKAKVAYALRVKLEQEDKPSKDDTKRAQKKRLNRAAKPKLDKERQRVRVGGKWYDVTSRSTDALATLFAARGGWVGGSELAATGGRAFHQLRASMPEPVQKTIESRNPDGYRIPALLPR